MFKYFLNLNLRSKLIWTMASFAAFFIILVTLIFTIKMHSSALSLQEGFLMREGEIIGKSIALGLDFGDKASVNDAYAAVKANLDFIVSYDIDGSVFLSYVRQGKDEKKVLAFLEQEIKEWKKKKNEKKNRGKKTKGKRGQIVQKYIFLFCVFFVILF